MNDCFLRIVILGVEYLIRFTYNDTYDCWSFGLYLPNKEPIAQNIKMPKVLFVCESNLEKVGRNAFLDGAARFCCIEG